MVRILLKFSVLLLTITVAFALFSCSLSPRLTRIPTNIFTNEGGNLVADTNPPVVTIVSPTNGEILYVSPVTITGTASDAESGVREVWLKLDGGSYGKVNGTTNWNTNLIGISYGSHTISVYAVDNSNNVSTTNSVSFTVSSLIVYVSTSGNDSNDGLTTSTPVRSLVRAMSIANVINSATNVEVRVGTGIYSNDDGLSNANVGFVVNRPNLVISGGWNSGFSSVVGSSELEGNGVLYHVIKIENVINVVLKNLVIRGGKANGSSPDDSGGGIYASNVSYLVIESNVVVSNNSANGNGGGIYLYGSSSSTISGSVYSNNATYGGGVFLWDSISTTLSGNVYSNSAYYYGGGVYLVNSSSNTISGSVYSNSALDGGGVFLNNSTNNMISGSVYGNSARNGGGVYLGNSSSNTISGNVYNNSAFHSGEIVVGFGGGLYLSYSENNTINGNVYSNRAHDNGGGLVLDNSTNNTISGSVYGNSARSGGGVFLNSSDYFTNLGWITNNTATGSGGGVYTNNPHPNSYFGHVSGNIPNDFN